MKNIDISYPVSHFNGIPITIPDKYTLSSIMGNIIGMNGPVYFDGYKFSAVHYQSKENGHLIGKVRLMISKKVNDEKWELVYLRPEESLETLETLIYKIMQKIDRFPDRDIRYEVRILDIDRE